MRSSAIVPVLLAAGLIAGPAHADRFELGLGTSNHFLASSSVDALSEDGMTAGSITAAMKIPWLRLAGFDALIEANLDTGSLSGRSFRTMRSDTSLRVTTVGVRVRRAIWRRVIGHAGVGLGAARVSLRLEDAASRVEAISDRAHAVAGYLGAGGDVLLARLRRDDGSHKFTLGLRAELGYHSIAPVRLLGSTGERDDDVIRIPATATSLGELDLSGWTMRFGVVTRF